MRQHLPFAGVRKRVNRKSYLVGSFILGVAATCCVSGWLQRQPAVSAQLDSRPILLRSVQDLGELHTARFTYDTVFEYKTHLNARNWSRYVPGVASVVEGTTRNSVLVSVDGAVEAGIDLAQASVDKAGDELVVTLPSPRVYEPKVHAKIHKHKVGIFWSDDNIALKAEAAAATRFKQASERQGIYATAKDNARKRVQTLAKSLGISGVSIRFA